jgi:hypothetical protein
MPHVAHPFARALPFKTYCVSKHALGTSVQNNVYFSEHTQQSMHLTVC